MTERPLSGIKIVGAVSGPLAGIARYFSDLGARVVSIGGGDALTLVDSAHIVLADTAAGIDLAALRARRPDAVTMLVSNFGSSNPLSDWQATDPVLHALSGELSRSGIRGRPPLLPPGELSFRCAAAQAAFALISALYRVLRGGAGAHFDFSALDGAVQALDPGFGIAGSAALGKPLGMLTRKRPRRGFQYPIFPCADGYVRICLLSKRQWQGMFAWLGEPDQFAGPEFDETAHRYASQDLLPFIGAFFAKKTRADLEREGMAHGVPISGLFSFEEYARSDHALERRARVREADGSLRPNGVMTIDGERMGSGAEAFEAAFASTGPGEPPALPLAGLKVLDLGVIVVGAEQSRLLADMGADVVKIESSAYPDGNRQSYLKHGMSVSFAAGHRNKRSLGIDLRSTEGRGLFLRLAAEADIVCSNFKPGTMEKLGLGADVLHRVNPALIVSESSAFGDTGPWSGRMGYGPLVRAATGVTQQWRYPEDPGSFSDSITVYPDHVVGRICAVAVVALLIRRLRTGEGGTSKVAQSEVVLDHFSSRLDESKGECRSDPRWPWGVFPAAGEDEWCVVTVRSHAECRALCNAICFADGASIDTLADHLSAWLSTRDRFDAAQELQAAGVPAAPMLRLRELPDHPYYRARNFFREDQHPWLLETVRVENFIVPTADIPAPSSRPAPLTGEQTEEVVAEWLNLDPHEIAALCQSRVLEPLRDSTRRQAEDHVGRGGGGRQPAAAVAAHER